MFYVTEVEKKELNLEEYYRFPNKPLFTTMEWLEFLEEDSKGELFFLRITDNDSLVGYFTGMVVNKFGIKIAGSPFSGWSTVYMGFDVYDGINKLDLIPCVQEYLFKHKKVVLIEIVDREISVKDAQEAGYNADIADTLELDIDKTDDELFKVFKTDCRNFIRQFERRGAVYERVAPSDEFAEEYYEQLKDVFAKQGLVPTYSVDKVKRLLHHLSDGETVLCQHVLDPDTKESIATSIFLAYNKTFYFWGGASYRSGQHYRPNEYMLWRAITYWRDNGYKTFDMVGVRDYKRKFGSHEVQYAHIMIAKYPALIKIRNFAKFLFFKMLELKGKILKRK